MAKVHCNFLGNLFLIKYLQVNDVASSAEYITM